MVKTEVVTTKVFWKSKTFWANIIGLVISFLLVLQGELQAGTILTAASVTNMFLRVVTKQGVSLSQ